MADVPDKSELGEGAEGRGDEADGSEENERPTVSPPFDPIAFARDILKPSPAPMPAVRPKAAISTPASGTAGPPSGAPERRTPPGTPAARLTPPAQKRRKTPTSTLSLVNTRIPSNLPPRPTTPKPDARIDAVPRDSARPQSPRKLESLSSMNVVDREWADLEIATRPPPPNEPGPDDEIPEPSDLSTRPPPPDSPEEDPIVEIFQDRGSSMDLDDVAPELDGPSPNVTTVELDDPDEHAADTVRRPAPGGEVKSRAREMTDRVSLGDYSGALEIAERILADTPDDKAALECAENCRTVLHQMYATRIGPLDRVPVVMVPRDQLRWLSIDHRAGFVLSLVDGVSTLEMIIDVSGMAELDTLRILSELAQQRIISLR